MDVSPTQEAVDEGLESGGAAPLTTACGQSRIQKDCSLATCMAIDRQLHMTFRPLPTSNGTAHLAAAHNLVSPHKITDHPKMLQQVLYEG